jgi:kynurenine formamidase
MCTPEHDLASRIGRPAAPVRGAARFITPDTVRHALGLVRTGTVIPLNLPLDTTPVGRPDMVLKPLMQDVRRELPDGRVNVINDDIVEFALQSHSHWDALAHWGVIEPEDDAVYYGGAGIEDTTPEFGSKTLGIETLAGGIVTRGVLFDMVAHIGDGGAYLAEGNDITPDAVRSYLSQHRLTLRPGDAAIFYTGFQHRLQADPKAWVRGPDFKPVAAGLSVETMPIWEEARTFALVADNPAVEPHPIGEGPLHAAAIKRLGIYLGELFDLEGLVQHCRASGQREFAFMSMPLNIPKAFGSPANAMAVL